MNPNLGDLSFVIVSTSNIQVRSPSLRTACRHLYGYSWQESSQVWHFEYSVQRSPNEHCFEVISAMGEKLSEIHTIGFI